MFDLVEILAVHPPPAFRSSRRGRDASGFTLLEILLSLAIIGLLAGILIAGSSALLNQKPQSVDEIFWAAVQEARKTALVQEREVRLRFFNDRDKGGKGFEVVDGGAVRPFPFPPAAAANDLTIDFLAVQKGGNAVLIAGVMVETQSVPHATFYPDGTCSPFRLQIVGGGGSHHVAVDPWTCAPILAAPDPNAPRI